MHHILHCKRDGTGFTIYIHFYRAGASEWKLSWIAYSSGAGTTLYGMTCREVQFRHPYSPLQRRHRLHPSIFIYLRRKRWRIFLKDRLYFRGQRSTDDDKAEGLICRHHFLYRDRRLRFNPSATFTEAEVMEGTLTAILLFPGPRLYGMTQSGGT